MNSLIILQSELLDQERALLVGARASYAFTTHGLVAGRAVRVAVVGGRRGNGTVLEASSDRIELSLHLSEEPLGRKPIDLVVGLSRPQTVKKTIQAAVMLGVRSLRFVLSERGQKSYRDSHVLTEDHLQFETIKALEQIWDSNPPQITVHHSLATLFAHKLLPDGVSSHVISLVAQPNAPELAASAHLFHPGASLKQPSSVVVAVGPEAGWSSAEVQSFLDRGFRPVGLGERVLRVEVALIYLLGQLDVLMAGGGGEREGDFSEL